MSASAAVPQPRRGPGRPPKPQEDPSSALAQLGGAMRRLRADRGLTLMGLSLLTGYSWQHLGAIERGQTGPSEAVVVACERALAAGGQLAAVFPAVVREQVSRRHRQETARRGALVADPDVDWSRLAAAARRPSAVSTALAEDLEQITGRQRVLYHELSSAEILLPVEAHLSLLSALMRGMQPEQVRHRIASAAAEAAGFAAWLWSDLGDQFKTRTLYQMAAGLLAEAGNPALGAYITGYRALAAEAAGLTAEAVQHAETARSQAPAGTSELTRSWLSAISASTLAVTGERRSALGLLGQARDHLDSAHAGYREDWMYDFDYSALAIYRGQCHLRLGQPRAAMTAFEAGRAELPGRCARRGAILAIGLAEACLAGHVLDAAMHHAYRALDVFAARGSTAGLLRVQTFRAMLSAAGHHRETTELDQRIRGYLRDTT